MVGPAVRRDIGIRMNPTIQRNTNEQALALSFVVILNWFIAHLVTSWTLPPEVQSAVQSIVTIGISYWLSRQPPAAAPQPAAQG